MAEPVAIIGIGCRFPGATNPTEFWSLLRNGVDAITEVPTSRWDIQSFYNPDPTTPGKVNTRWGGFLDEVDVFDRSFFRVSPREASRMDPQQRLLLEVAYEALEDAGQNLAQIAGSRTGVFIGISTNDYGRLQYQWPDQIDSYVNTGSTLSIAANRLSYIFDLHGPSFIIDTACSSSLLATHLACQSLASGESTLALVGGVNLILAPDATIGFSKMSAMSPDGRCKAFDAKANGYVRSEGCGVVILKRLSEAQRDHDMIYGVILGSAANNDGHSNGLTAPNGNAQRQVIQAALTHAGLSGTQISYVETHGTGTPLGDPIEVKALNTVLGQDRPSGSKFSIGSVKTNIGHTEAAAGMASLIKVALSLTHREIPPSIHFSEPNPYIPFADMSVAVQDRLTSWPDESLPCTAGVSGFGFGGTNVHLIVQEAPKTNIPESVEAVPPYLLTLSAQQPDALQSTIWRYADFFRTMPANLALRDVCYTAASRRTHHNHRISIVADSISQMIERLDTIQQGQIVPGVSTGTKTNREPKIVFVFPGQGSQWPGMARELLKTEPTFRQALEQCEAAMQPYVDWSLRETLKIGAAIERIDIIQPVLFAISVGLAVLWKSWGITPDAVLGHSMGEIGAAHIAGILPLEDAVRIICRRSQLLRRVSGQGSMALVELSLEATREALSGFEGQVSIAVSNSPRATVISGDPDAVNSILANLATRDIFCKLIKVDVASHSPQMDALKESLFSALEGVSSQSSQILFYSTVLDTVCEGSHLDANYWVANLREPVLFASAVQNLCKEGYNTFIELSPHPILTAAIEQNFVDEAPLVLASLHRQEGERTSLFAALGALYCRGCQSNWDALYPDGGVQVTLPTYAWQHERFWFDLPSQPLSTPVQEHPLLGTKVQSALQPHVHIWEREISVSTFPYLKDHLVLDMVILPGAAYLELALAAARDVFGEGSHQLGDVIIQKALFFPDEQAQKLQIVISKESPTQAQFQIFSYQTESAEQESEWLLHITGSLYLNVPTEPQISAIDPARIQAEALESYARDLYYRSQKKRKLVIGPSLQMVEQIWWKPGEVIGRIMPSPQIAAEAHHYLIHPALLDSCIQFLAPCTPRESFSTADTVIPVGLERLIVYQRPDHSKPLWNYVTVRTDRPEDADYYDMDMTVFDEDYQVLFKLCGLRGQRIGRKVEENPEEWLYRLNWKLEAPAPTAPLTEDREWVLFVDREGVGKDLAKRLPQSHVVLIESGQSYSAISKNHYQIDPGAPADYVRVLTAIAEPATKGMRREIVYLWGLDTRLPNDHLTEDQLRFSLGSILLLIQAMQQIDANWRLWFITQNAQAVDADGQKQTLNLMQSPLWGLGRTIAHEHVDWRCARIDLGSASKVELDTLRQELASSVFRPEVALRGTTRYIPLLETGAEGIHSSEHFTIRPDSTYLITGGLGSLGLDIADWLVNLGACFLALVGRRSPSPEAQERLEALRQKGVQIKIFQVDLNRRDDLDQMLRSMAIEMPALRGLVHAAGILDDSLLINMDWSQFWHAAAPKIQAAWNLHTLTAPLPLDFFILFSSAAALLGSPGQANYTAGNMFMDLLAHYRRAQGLPALSINWGPWADTGLAAKADLHGRLNRLGYTSLRRTQGIAALDHVVKMPGSVAQIGVMIWDVQRWQQFNPDMSQFALVKHLLADVVTQGEIDPLQNEPNRQPAQFVDSLRAIESVSQRLAALEDHLRDQTGRVLRLPPAQIQRDTPLASLGFDSLIALEFRKLLETSLQITLSSTLAFNYPTIGELGTFLLHKLALDEVADEEAEIDLSSGENTALLSLIETLNGLSAESLGQLLESTDLK